MVENQRFRVEVNVRGSSKKVLLSAPNGLDLVAAAKAFKGFTKDKNVQKKLADLDKDCNVEILALKNEIIGMSIPDGCEEGKV